tara:strand:+ start:3004 stop:3279 length:276 start_codon:yes stop_codon:yes gene_type:complete
MKNNDQQRAFEALSFLNTATGEYLGIRDFIKSTIEAAQDLAYAEEARLEVCVIFPNLYQSAPAALVFTSDSDLPLLLTELVQDAARKGLEQ